MQKLPVAPLGPVDYSSSVPPSVYRCHSCGVHGVKLWRDYNTFLEHQSILCAKCACKEQKKGEVRVVGLKMFVNGNQGDQIGWRIPAVPTADGESYWGYTLVPEDGVNWWKALPLEKS